MSSVDDALILCQIQDVYVPFLKKLIAHFERKDKVNLNSISILKELHSIFTSGSSDKQIEAFLVNRTKLEKLHNKAQKNKYPLNSGVTESSNILSEDVQPPAKRLCTYSKADNLKLSSNETEHRISLHGPSSTIEIKQETQDKSEKLQFDISSSCSLSNHGTTPKLISVDSSKNPPQSTLVQNISRFQCLYCKFQTEIEHEFIDHTNERHKKDLSLWCKQCGKCFSSAGSLAWHIKEGACIKEEIFYQCSVLNCDFETTRGQNFIDHLNKDHKRLPFILCLHCEKVFSVPHCLVLHMQDECRFKHKNRRPVDGITTKNLTEVGIFPNLGLRGQVCKQSEISRNHCSTISVSETNLYSFQWQNCEQLPKKVEDVTSLNSSSRNSGKITCPCCDLAAEHQSDLRNHYLIDHKKADKNACLECLLKFETVDLFLDHFEEHRKGLLSNQLLFDATKKVDFGSKSKLADSSVNEKTKELHPLTAVIVKPADHSAVERAKQGPLTTEAIKQPSLLIKEGYQQSNKSSVLKCLDEVFISIYDAKLKTPLHNGDKTLKMPNQPDICYGNVQDLKLQTFIQMKSSTDLNAMMTVEKLKHFFKCAFCYCTFTTDIINDFAEHLKTVHGGKLYHCCYCLEENTDPDSATLHMAFKHKNRVYQCSQCFYRASSEAHVKIHVKANHTQSIDFDILLCDAIVVLLPKNLEYEETASFPHPVWPYICSVPQCSYSSNDPKMFRKHCDAIHGEAREFMCKYCFIDFPSIKQLLQHYRVHGINMFQCYNCIHGTDTKENILLHLCIKHADEPFRVYVRDTKRCVATETNHLKTIVLQSLGMKVPDSSLDIANKARKNNNKKGVLFSGCEDELYHASNFYAKTSTMICFPRYLRNILSDVLCGVPFCNEIFESMELYLSHLRHVHKALNFPCPYCPEMLDSWDTFKHHLLCHGSKLYVCNTKECEFYDCNKQVIKDHKKEHINAGYSLFSVREFFSSADEYKLTTLKLKTGFPNVERSFICFFCKYKSNELNVMKNHMYREMAYERFICSLCEKRCTSRREIKEHFIACHPETDIMYSEDSNHKIETAVKLFLMQKQECQNKTVTLHCTACFKKFKNQLQLGLHLRLCLQQQYRPYECHACQKSCANLLILKYHTDKEHPNIMEYSLISSDTVEADIKKQLSKTRLDHLMKYFTENSLETYKIKHVSKFYGCSSCVFRANHKFNAERHVIKKHPRKAEVIKDYNYSESSQNNLEFQWCKNSDGDASSGNLVKRYLCGRCPEKMLTILDLKQHTRKTHVVNGPQYCYYYFPDVSTDINIYSNDEHIYVCPYCPKYKDRLCNLKKHCDDEHAEKEFKVRGFISYDPTQRNYVACGYCYVRFEDLRELEKHLISSHSNVPVKRFGNFKVEKFLRESKDFFYKQVKFHCTVAICSLCGFVCILDHLTFHFRQYHKKLKMQYTIKYDGPTNIFEADSLKFYECEFCDFVGERHFLEDHLSVKHKSAVMCLYCNHPFENTCSLDEHCSLFHKHFPKKYRELFSTKTIIRSGVPESGSTKTIIRSGVPESASTKTIIRSGVPESGSTKTIIRSGVPESGSTKTIIRSGVPESGSTKTIIRSGVPESGSTKTIIHSGVPESGSTKTIIRSGVPESGRCNSNSDNVTAGFTSHYGIKPEPVDLCTLTVRTVTADGQAADLPFSVINERYNLFPRVILKDILKGGRIVYS